MTASVPPAAIATVIEGPRDILGRRMTIRADETRGSIRPGAIDAAIEREARAVLDDGEARILSFSGRPTIRALVEPLVRGDLEDHLERARAEGTATAEVIDLSTGLHTVALADGLVWGGFGLEGETASDVAGCLRSGEHRLIDEGDEGRRIFIRVTIPSSAKNRG